MPPKKEEVLKECGYVFTIAIGSGEGAKDFATLLYERIKQEVLSESIPQGVELHVTPLEPVLPLVITTFGHVPNPIEEQARLVE